MNVMKKTHYEASMHESHYGRGKLEGLAEGKAEGLAEGEAKSRRISRRKNRRIGKGELKGKNQDSQSHA